MILFGADAVPRLLAELAGAPYALITTPRAAEGPGGAGLLAGAAARHDVAAGRVDAVAGAMRAGVGSELLVALGGGRVIDVAKALAAADPPRRVAAVPTTLSAAERAGARSLGELGVDDATLDACADQAAGRPELGLIPPAAARRVAPRLRRGLLTSACPSGGEAGRPDGRTRDARTADEGTRGRQTRDGRTGGRLPWLAPWLACPASSVPSASPSP